jgi:DNA repair exonuclease SbcCD ATPase subunit
VLGGFGLVVMGFVLKMFRDGQIMDLKERVEELDAAKQEAEHMLQDAVWKGKTARQAKDSVTRDLEDSIERMETMILELTAKEQALKARDDELRAIKSSGSTPRPMLVGADGGDQALRAETMRLAEALHARDGEIKELRQQLSGKARLWENQLQTKEDLLKRRAAELEIARSETSELGAQVKELEAAARRAEELLQKELQNKKEVIEANDAANRNPAIVSVCSRVMRASLLLSTRSCIYLPWQRNRRNPNWQPFAPTWRRNAMQAKAMSRNWDRVSATTSAICKLRSRSGIYLSRHATVRSTR